MRKVVVSEFISLDGVIENPAWTFEFQSPEQDAFKFAELRDADALLLGRVTYEGFAAAWPGMAAETGEYGAWMNGYPKYVASNTLDTAEWNASIIEGDLAEGVNRLKQQPGKDILVFGSGKLAESLMRLDLVDEYRLIVYPIVLGQGQKLFVDNIGAKMKLVKSEVFSSGAILLVYEAVSGGGGGMTPPRRLRAATLPRARERVGMLTGTGGDGAGGCMAWAFTPPRAAARPSPAEGRVGSTRTLRARAKRPLCQTCFPNSAARLQPRGAVLCALGVWRLRL